MTRIILSTSNIINGGPSIIRKPGAEPSNLEFINSLRSNFIAAQEDYSLPLSTSNSMNNSDDEERPSNRPQVSIWTTRRGSDYYIPKIDWSMGGLKEEPSQYEVTVKLFYLPGADVTDRPSYTKDAIALVLKALGVEVIDLLVVSYPGMSFEGGSEEEADRRNAEQGNIDQEIKSWAHIEDLYARSIVRKLGLAEFGSQKLRNFISRVKIRPEVDQINIKDCCKVPKSLIKLAKSENVELLTHSDFTNILPSGTLRELLGQGAKGAGVLAESKCGLDGMKGDLKPQWVVKYTAVVRDRGVIENKGYFAAAELRE